ncbi:hypothetical protein Nmel_004009 [Mimus melanotis]
MPPLHHPESEITASTGSKTESSCKICWDLY